MLGTSFALGLLALGLAAAAALLPRLSADTRVGAGLVGGLTAVAAGHLAWRAWRRRGLRVLVGREGLGRSWGGRQEVYLWDEVLGVEEPADDESVGSLEVEFLDGNAWELDAGLVDFDRLRALIASRGAD
jgi:hypothetical protein